MERRLPCPFRLGMMLVETNLRRVGVGVVEMGGGWIGVVLVGAREGAEAALTPGVSPREREGALTLALSPREGEGVRGFG